MQSFEHQHFKSYLRMQNYQGSRTGEVYNKYLEEFFGNRIYITKFKPDTTNNVETYIIGSLVEMKPGLFRESRSRSQ